jgi:hypothetical protein
MQECRLELGDVMSPEESWLVTADQWPIASRTQPVNLEVL